MTPHVESTSASVRLNKMLLGICLECPELRNVAKIAGECLEINFNARRPPQQILDGLQK